MSAGALIITPYRGKDLLAFRDDHQVRLRYEHFALQNQSLRLTWHFIRLYAYITAQSERALFIRHQKRGVEPVRFGGAYGSNVEHGLVYSSEPGLGSPDRPAGTGAFSVATTGYVLGMLEDLDCRSE